jgi:hemolysin III
MINKTLRKQEEIVNSLTHGIGFIGAIALTVLLVHKASIYGDVWHIVSFSIFGIGMMLVYLSSTLYHK